MIKVQKLELKIKSHLWLGGSTLTELQTPLLTKPTNMKGTQWRRSTLEKKLCLCVMTVVEGSNEVVEICPVHLDSVELNYSYLRADHWTNVGRRARRPCSTWQRLSDLPLQMSPGACRLRAWFHHPGNRFPDRQSWQRWCHTCWTGVWPSSAWTCSSPSDCRGRRTCRGERGDGEVHSHTHVVTSRQRGEGRASLTRRWEEDIF